MTENILNESAYNISISTISTESPWSVDPIPNRNPDKSIRILIGVRTNQSESQSEQGQSMSRTITT